MIRAILAAGLALCLAGCAPRVGGVRPDDLPSGKDAVADSAERSARDYAAKLATTARASADKAGEWKSHAEAFDWTSAAYKAGREEAFAPYEDALTFAMKPETSEYDASTFAKSQRSAAVGFERVAKGKP